MRLTTFRRGAENRVAAVSDGLVIDLADAHAAAGASGELPATLPTLLAADGTVASAVERAVAAAAGDPAQARQAGIAIPVEEAEFAPLIPEPGKFLCVGRNYADHINEAGRPMPEVPVLFARFRESLIGHRASIVRPTASHELDWEGELAVVIGRHCRPTTRDEALDAVAGYAIFNDVSLRDYQMRGVQWTAGKNFFSTGGFGPWLVPAREIPDPQALELEVRVNGTTTQHANTKDMIFDVATLIMHVAEWLPLAPGDVIATGTPSGVGFVRTPPWFLEPGDVVEVEIEGIGTLVNTVVDA